MEGPDPVDTVGLERFKLNIRCFRTPRAPSLSSQAALEDSNTTQITQSSNDGGTRPQ